MDNHNYCVIMAGGIGARFWPVSREEMPKQFLPMTPDGKSFLRLAYERFAGIFPDDHILVVSQRRYDEMVRETLPEILDENIILEPYSRNTAPCLALAAYILLKRDPEAVMVATPADHIILDEDIFRDTITRAMCYASRSDALITLGIVPDHPDTNFGYIQGVHVDPGEDGKPIKVKTFTEKPDAALAEVFFQSGEFYWNSGIFVWRAESIQVELEKHMPETAILFRGWEQALDTPEQDAFLERVYSSISKISIDYAVMEKTEKAWVFPSKFRWHDIGNWEALYSFVAGLGLEPDGNVTLAGPSLCGDNQDTLIYASDREKLIAVRGLNNFIVVDTGDVLLICPRDEQAAKDVIANVAMPEYEKFR
jgi:mannose-1-phosphate guanylyltransferase